ncbi:C25 family cysteine peptidase [Arenicella sp.]|nr:C25 family cysteine peptidase [Arenicella sp.]
MRRLLKLVFVGISLFIVQAANAQTPVVNTTIAVNKTGSEPFDSQTWTNPDLTTAGLDEDEDNNVVRLQDSITYKVEVSVNDADVDDLTATVKLVNKQVWINIPTGCKVDPADVTAQPVSFISADGTELFCNLGPAIEGTTKIFFPPARVVGFDPLSASTDPDYITLNNDVVFAEVEAGADGNPNLASDGQTETIVTAFFRVNTIKEPKVNATDPDSGAWLYKAVAKEGPNGEAGTLVEYRISAQYVNGSMIADSDEVTFEADYDLFDFYTDDNTNNNASMNPTPNPPAATSPLTGPFSSGGILYTWDATTPGCSLDGNHGANAVVNCIQNDLTPSDYAAANAPIGGYAGDGFNDPTVEVDIDNIDVRDPDGDGNLFEVIINIWFNDSNDILSHQDCVGNACIVTILQDIGTLDNGAISGFNPISTEDAGGNNLDNYNGAGEPIPNRVIYPLARPGNPGYSVRKTFDRFPTSTPSKYADQNVAAGSIKPVSLEVYDYRFVDQNKTQVCDNIDISVYEFAGLSSGSSIMRTTVSNNGLFPANIAVWTAGNFSASNAFIDGDPYMTELYSDLPYVDASGVPLAIGVPTGSTAADTNVTNLAWHTALRDSTCGDDLNNDGLVNIKPMGAAAPFPASPIDWYEDPTEMPGGVGDTTRFRGELTYDEAAILPLNPAADRFVGSWELDLQVKLIANGYADRNMLPNWMVSRRTESIDTSTYSAWGTETADVADYDAVNFATTARYADRNILVPSGHSVEKYTDPRGIKVVRAGDLVDFILEPKVFGLWDTGLVNTANVSDNLPVGSVYQANSEEFSIDGGVTWLSRADYDASNPDITITTAANAGGADPLRYFFGSVEPGEQLPLIRYTVQMDPALVSGTFRNTVTLTSGLDENKSQNYSLTILPEFGLDVVKVVDYPIYETNEPFEFDLIYKNLGGETYSEGRFIDILPFVGDDTGTTSGLASDRDPGTDYTGIYELSAVSIANGETVYVTDRNPALLNVDPCHEDNLPAGYVPTANTELCFEYYNQQIVNPPKPAQTFVGGASAGTGATVWTACALPLSCAAIANEDITAVRFDVPNVGTGGGETVTLELTPLGNTGGVANLDALGNVTSGATGDIYTNTFGGRVPSISLNVISNDVSVTVVNGSIGNYVWWDAGADGVQDNDPIAGVNVALLDSTGAPVYVDPVDGGIVNAAYPGAIPYTTMTDAMGLYLFDNLPSGTYQVQVTPPAGAFQTYDFDGLGTPNISTYTLAREEDSVGQLLDVEDNDEQDFGYARNPLLTLAKVIDNAGGGTAVLADFPLAYSGAAATGSGVSGTPAVTDVAVPVGTYMISETNLTDYAASAFVCAGGSDANPADGLDLEAFDEVVCTITNTFMPMPSLQTLKGVDTSGLQTPPLAGDILTYTITVENDGNVPVTMMSVIDAKLGGDITSACVFPISALDGLDVGEIATCMVDYAITQEDLEAGEVINTADAAGLDPSGGGVDDTSDSTQPADDTGNDDDPTVVPLTQTPEIELVKSSVIDLGGDGIVDVGDTITYTYEVANTGNITVFNIAITEDPLQFTGDPLFLTAPAYLSGGGDLDNGAGTATDINPAETVTFTATYTIQQADIDRGSVVNSATADGESVGGPVDDVSDSGNPADDMGTDEDPTVNPFAAVPQIGSIKSASVGPILPDGTFEVTYTIVVENTGNVTLAPLTLIDDLTALDQLSGAFNGVVMQPIVTDVVNTASTLPTSNDPMYDGTNELVIGSDGILVPGDSYQVVFTANVNPNAPTAGFQNTATASGTSPGGIPVVDDTNTGTDVDGNPTGETPGDNPGGPGNGPGEPTPIQPPIGMPALEVIKTGTLNANGTIDYVISVANIGNVNVLDIVVSDPIIGVLTYDPLDDGDGDLDIDLLAPGSTALVTATYTLSADDIAAGEVVNTATALGQDPSGTPVTDDSDSGNPIDDTGADDDATVTPVSTGLGVAKDLQAGSPVDLGNGSYQVTYEFVINNTGILDLSDLQITDDLNTMINNPNPNNATFSAAVVSSPNNTLTPNPSYNGDSNIDMLAGTDTLLVGETALLELTFVFTPDVYFGPFLNQVEATAKDPAGGDVSDLSEDGPSVNPDSESPTPFSLTTPSTPITLGWFTSQREGDETVFEWATEVEVSNVGFYLSARDENGQWQRLNATMIESKGDSVNAQTYQLVVSGISSTTFLFTDVSVSGAQVDHGPFELGQSYGVQTTRKQTDWEEIERENEMKRQQREHQRQQEMQQRLRQLIDQGASVDSSEVHQQSAFSRIAGFLLTALVAPVEAAELVTFGVTDAGLYEVSHAQLLDHGVDLRGVAIDRIGLKQNGELWPVKVQSDTSDEFQSNSVLIFPGTGIDTLYSGDNKYVLVIDEGSKQVQDDSRIVPDSPIAYSYLAEKRYAPQNNYSHISPDENDSWFADSVRAISKPASKQIELSVNDYAPALNSSFSTQEVLRPRLEVELWGASDLPGNGLQAPDHNVLISLNELQINEVKFDGLHLSLSSDVVTNLKHGNNIIDITLPRDHGYQFDIVNINSVSINYPRKFIAESAGNGLAFESNWNKFRVSDMASTDVLVVRVDYSAQGDVSAFEMTARDTGNCVSGCVYFAGSETSQASQYFVATTQGRKSPLIETLPISQDISEGDAEYLIIAHPDFINTDGSLLQAYANDLQSIYSSVAIVDVDDVYANYSDHVFDAQAIHLFIRDAYAKRGTRHVMLVGGDTYDYRNNLGTDSVSFIPSLYVPIATNVNAVASDASYADVDDDLVPDITISRLPVRSETELANVLSKRQRYLSQPMQNSVLFAADKEDSSGYSFKADSVQLSTDYFSDWTVREAYLDDVSIAEGKSIISQALNAGAALTSYSGHSSTDRWAISGLFTGEDVPNLNNLSSPTVVAQWGCWNTFYTSPEEDSLAQRLLVESELGAVTVMGATSFTKARAEQKMAELLYARLKQGMRIGDAVLSAKQAFAVDNPYQLDILLGWAVLGPDDMAIIQ